MQELVLLNDYVTAKIDPHGAQLSSLIRRQTGEEFIWQRDPAYWTESAPILFPIVGGLKNGTYQYEGKTYSMPKHGIVRHADFSVSEQTRSACTLTIESDQDSLLSYPFRFRLDISFELTQQGIRVNYRIKNTDNKRMPTGLGYHPAFAIDVEHYRHTDYEVVFSQPETQDLYGLKEDGLLGLVQPNYLVAEDTIQLTEHIFDHDALVFKNIDSRQLTLRRRASNWKVVMFTSGAPHLGIWAKPGAPYVCLEPWYTYQDSAQVSGDIFEKPGMFVLAPGEVFASFYEIQV